MWVIDCHVFFSSDGLMRDWNFSIRNSIPRLHSQPWRWAFSTSILVFWCRGTVDHSLRNAYWEPKLFKNEDYLAFLMLHLEGAHTPWQAQSGHSEKWHHRTHLLLGDGIFSLVGQVWALLYTLFLMTSASRLHSPAHVTSSLWCFKSAVCPQPCLGLQQLDSIWKCPPR